jgi:hypothetical protein
MKFCAKRQLIFPRRSSTAAPYDNLGLIERGGEIAVAGAALWVASWALRRLLGRR